MIAPDKIEQVKDASDIVEVLSDYLQMKRAKFQHSRPESSSNPFKEAITSNLINILAHQFQNPIGNYIFTHSDSFRLLSARAQLTIFQRTEKANDRSTLNDS